MDNALFVESAKRFENECTRDRDRPELRRALRGQDPCLDVLWNNREREFVVAVRVSPGEGPKPYGYPVRLFSCGTDPRIDDVMSEVRRRRLRGRAKERAREVVKTAAAEDAANTKAMTDKFMPGFGEYASRIVKCDNEWTANSLCEDMAKEVRRTT